MSGRKTALIELEKKMRKAIGAGIMALGLTLMVLLAGCEGSESRDKVDATVETMAGKEQTDQFKEAKDKIKEIEAQQADRYKELEE
jgi:ribonucleotide reductase alpha subunit